VPRQFLRTGEMLEIPYDAPEYSAAVHHRRSLLSISRRQRTCVEFESEKVMLLHRREIQEMTLKLGCKRAYLLRQLGKRANRTRAAVVALDIRPLGPEYLVRQLSANGRHRQAPAGIRRRMHARDAVPCENHMCVCVCGEQVAYFIFLLLQELCM
jgi:hypothetical protein